jgi:hypothetical protein
LVSYIFKESQENNLDLIISTKPLSKRANTAVKITVFFSMEIMISILVIIIISCFIPMMKDMNTTRLFSLYLNIFVMNLIIALVFGGVALVISLSVSKVVVTLSPIVLSVACVAMSIGFTYSKLNPADAMMLKDNIQATTINYYAQSTGANTAGQMRKGVYFTSYNPNVVFNSPSVARNYFAKFQGGYNKATLIGNVTQQFAMMSNAINLGK